MAILVKKLVIFFGVIFVISFVILVVFFSTGGILGNCSDDIIERAISPDERYEVELLVRDCGATTPVATHVSLLQNSQKHKISLFIIEGNSPMKVQWVNSKNLEISFENSSKATIFKQMEYWKDIHISYDLSR